MLEGRNIICFAKDWTEDPTSNNHVMRGLARCNRVLWLNSIATRRPALTDTRDLGKMLSKLRAFARGPVEVERNLWVYTPLVIPLPGSAVAAAVNRQVVRQTVGWLRRRLGMDRYQLWTFLPTALPYLSLPGVSLVVYYATDDWTQFGYLDGARLGAMEQALCGRCDIVFATARRLQERLRQWCPETHLALHGVDYQHFASALAPETEPAEELASLPRPILGFVGLIHEWLDLELLALLARRHPEWSIVLIGKVVTDVSQLGAYPNIKLLGRRPYADLPRYCRALSVGLIPFVVNELTRSVNPIKLREYLSAGLPVVSTPLPEVESYAGLCWTANTGEEFVAACEQAVQNDTPEERHRRSAAMASETWEARIAEIGRIVMEVEMRRRPDRAGRPGLPRG